MDGIYSGFVVDCRESRAYKNFEDFINQIMQKTSLDLSKLAEGKVQYHSSYQRKLALHYQGDGLKAKGWIDGKEVRYDQWSQGWVYDSPYVRVG
ncbi:MAG: hypothetical protein HC880_17980 [Bacteroidia bacterium]|nr:hypothetical protein [Bacteroidia bacterium]